MLKLRLSYLLVLLAGLLLVAGCGESAGELKGSGDEQILNSDQDAPLPSLLPADLSNGPATAVTLANLLAQPESYKGRLLQVEGLFKSSPEQTCPDKRSGDPTSWMLAEGQNQIPAAGLENLAAALPDGQITLVVEGSWRTWPIPVACRSEGDGTELYYLDVDRVISPNPIALAPGGAGTLPQVSSQSTADQALPPAATQPATVPTATPSSEQIQPLLSTSEPGAAVTPVSGPTGTPESYPAPLATPVDTPGGYPGPQVTVEIEAGSYPGPVQSTATAVPIATGPLDRDLLPVDSLETGVLGPELADRWTHVITVSQAITVQVVPDAGLELIVTIMNRNGQVLSAETSAGPGQKVMLPAVLLPEAGEYTILLTPYEDGAGNYAVLLTNETSYNFVLQENLVDGLNHSGVLDQESDHFWHFSGVAGDSLDITARPLDTADLFLRLFDPNGRVILAYHDENPAGQIEQIVEYTLPETGLYSILIGEEAFAGGAYEVVLDRR